MSTLKDVAEKSGVTVTTVSRMLNGRGYISEKTRVKINDAMRELNYKPNEIARALSKKHSNFIGLIVPSASNMYFSKIIGCVEHLVTGSGYKLLLCVSNDEEKKELEYFSMLSASKVAGIILASHTQDINPGAAVDAPIISLDRTLSPHIPSVCSDNYRGGVLAAEHLIAKGCKKLAHISGSSYLNMEANKRFFGFKEVCEKRGVPYVAVDATEEQFLSMRYENVISSLLDSHPDLDGIFTSNDIIAAQVIKICSKRGIRIPEQIKVVGYDDIELCKFCTPSITTIHQPVRDICQCAVECIVMGSDKKAIPTNVTFPVTLVEREST